MPEYSETVYWLAFINESGLKLSRIKPIVQRWCVVEQRSLADLFDMSPLDWSTTFGLTEAEAQQVQQTHRKLEQQAKALAQWQSQGIETLLRIDPRYPQRLAQSLPPAQQPLVLWVQGTPELLNEPGVAMLGGQAPDEEAAHLIEELMGALVIEEINLVSGYGRGLDRATFETMLTTAGGHALAIIPMGLAAFAKTTTKLNQALQSGQIALVSPFAPDTPYQEKLAEARNALIDHLALVLLILDPDDESAARGTAALERAIPVLLAGRADSTTDNHRALLNQGALLLTDAGEVIEVVQQAIIDATLPEPGEQPVFGPAPEPAAITKSKPDDDYSLHTDTVEPIDSQEALEILSLGGEIPEVLRRRLQKPPDDESINPS